MSSRQHRRSLLPVPASASSAARWAISPGICSMRASSRSARTRSTSCAFCAFSATPTGCACRCCATSRFWRRSSRWRWKFSTNGCVIPRSLPGPSPKAAISSASTCYPAPRVARWRWPRTPASPSPRLARRSHTEKTPTTRTFGSRRRSRRSRTCAMRLTGWPLARSWRPPSPCWPAPASERVGSLLTVALYRKYRPATFADVVGQEHVTEPLSVALGAGRIHHAYLFSGPRGCGKTSCARILARSLNCSQGPTSSPCGVCESCVALAPNGPGSIDVVELDAASHGGVDDTRELRDRAFYAPAQSRYRVFIVDEAHMVTTAGFNALLKIVEEPPEHLIFIFATTEPEKVLPTIRSRTHHYPFRLLPPRTMRALVGRICEQEGVAVDDAVYPLVIRAGGGSPRDTLSVLDQLVAGAEGDRVSYQRALGLLGATDIALVDEAVDALAAEDAAALFGAVESVIDAGHDPRRFATDLLERFRDLIVLQSVPDAAARGVVDAPEDVLERMRDQAARIGMATLTRYAEVVQAGLGEMRGATAPRLLLEVLCARLLLPSAGDSESALLQRLERIENRLDMSIPASPQPRVAFERPSARPKTPEPERGSAPEAESEPVLNAEAKPEPVPGPPVQSSVPAAAPGEPGA